MNTINFQPFAGIKENAINYLNDVFVRKSQIMQNIDYPLTFHDYFEMELIVSGKAIISFPGSEDIVLTAGSAYLASPVHAHSVCFEKDTILFNISFTNNILTNKIAEMLKSYPRPLIASFSGKDLDSIYDMLEQMLEEFSNRFHMYKTVISNILQNIIIMLLRLAPDNSDNNTSLAQQCLFIVHNNFKNNLSLGEVADMLNVSASYLGKMFKKNFNCSFNAYLNSLKISYAQWLLTGTSLSIKEIASASGFQSVEYFNYTFKKHTNTSPSEYRKTFSDIETQLHEYLLHE